MFSQMTPDEHPPDATALPMASSHSLYPPSSSFRLFGAACVMLCCSPPPASSSTPLRPSECYPSISLAVTVMCIRILCDHLHVLYIFDPTCIVLQSGWNSTARMLRLVVFHPSLSPPHPQTPPPRRWPALITLPPLAKFRLRIR